MISEVENTPLTEAISFDSSALHGLRGFAAVHLLIFHSLHYSVWGFETYGNVSIQCIGIENHQDLIYLVNWHFS